MRSKNFYGNIFFLLFISFLCSNTIWSQVKGFGSLSDQTVYIRTSDIPRITITKDGNVGVGTVTPGNYTLAVEGILGARVIEVKASSWADFVFDKNYRLRPLKEVEDSITINKHLPGVPSEEQVKKEGINVADMNTILLQKIEELTLYAIEQNKRMEQQDKRMEAFEKENALLREKLNRQ